MGIRSTKELEEVIEWSFSFCETDNATLGFEVYVVTGLTKSCRAISVAVVVSEDGKFVTLHARTPSREEFSRYFLKG